MVTTVQLNLFIEVVPAFGVHQPLVIHGKGFNQGLPQAFCGPALELDTTGRRAGVVVTAMITSRL